MRITPEAKQRTRARILEAGRKLFADKGFGKTTTRDVAARARIAAGTLFNYFPTKEALAMTLFAEDLDGARDDFWSRRRGEETPPEDLCANLAAGLRALAPHRHYVGEVFETAMSPFARSTVRREGDDERTAHLETVARILAEHGVAAPPSFVSMHLYWTLFLGIVAFWSSDESPHQEDSLAVLDESLRLFVASLESAGGDEPAAHARRR